MKIIFNGQSIGTIVTNKSMTIAEAIYSLGYDVNDPKDCEKAYNDGFAPAYCDDEGNYCIDTEACKLTSVERLYTVVSERQGDSWEESFEDREAAISKARANWEHLTATEQKKFHEYVMEHDPEDYPGGDYIWMDGAEQ